MKKIYSLVAVLATSFAVNAQTNLAVNGNLEDWPEATQQAPGWFMNSTLLSNGSITKHTTGAQEGTNYVSISSPSSSNNNVSLSDIELTPGTSYIVKYWYKTAPNTKLKHWIQWRDASNANIDGFANSSPEQPQQDNAINANWTEVTLTLTPPANAVKMRIAFRNYSGGALASIDNVSVTVADAASIKENNIEGLKVYPNPASDLINISSNEIGTKEVVIFNVLGKKILETSTEESVNVSNLTSGVYIINITQDGKKASRKLVIK